MLSTITVALSTPPNITVLTPLISCAIMTDICLSSSRTIVPMEYTGEQYFTTKNTVIKYERFLLKELGFCVHVQHPHKVCLFAIVASFD